MILSNLYKPITKEFNFIDPFTDEPTDIFITVHSLKSKLGKEVTHNMQLSLLALKDDVNNLNEDKTIKEDIQLVETIKWVSSLVSNWRGLQDNQGKDIKPTFDNVVTTFTNYKELIDATYSFASKVGNFQTV